TVRQGAVSAGHLLAGTVGLDEKTLLRVRLELERGDELEYAFRAVQARSVSAHPDDPWARKSGVPARARGRSRRSQPSQRRKSGELCPRRRSSASSSISSSGDISSRWPRRR